MRPVATRIARVVTALIVASSLVTGTAQADEQLEALEEQAFREAAALAEPSIVRIETVGGLDFVDGLLTPAGPTTGVVVGEDGWIITSSFNFAGQPASIVVMTADGARYPAVITARDEARQLTLLKIDASGLTPAVPAPQGEVRVGQWAIALGRTYDQPFPNLSVGIVSALGRIWGRAIQTDAKVSPTNYGGPLIDVQGRTLGILVPLDPQKSEETAGVEWYDSGIGFAIPLEDIYTVLARLQGGENLKPGKMGIQFEDVSPTAGAPIIQSVRGGSPGAEAGLKTGDRITKVDDRPVSRVPDVRHLLGRKYAGDTITLTYVRGDAEATAQLTLVDTLRAYEAPMLGVLPQRAASAGAATPGVPVRFVLPDSPAAKAGILTGDIITQAAGEAVANAAALRAILARMKSGESIEIAFQRNGEEQKATCELVGMSADVPDDLPLPSPPPRNPDAATAAKTGRWVDALGGDETRSYWAYVSGDYDAGAPCGLVVWMHPTGNTMEADVLKAWQDVCDERGIILVGPKNSQASGWKPDDVDFAKDLIEEMREKYVVDPARVVVHGYDDGGRIAAAVAFRERDVVRGLSLVGSGLRAQPPETIPESPLQIHLTCGKNDPALEAVEGTAEALREMKYPTATVIVPDVAHEYPSADVVDAIARWVDALDRL